MKVIFLDIDGVLNTSDTYINIRKEYQKTGLINLEIDEFRLEYLKNIIDSTDAKVVLASEWRHGFTKQNNKVIPRNNKGKRFYELLSRYDIELYDMIPNIYSEINRETQINYWLSINNDVESFVIIDDEPNMFNSLLERLIKTSKLKDNEMLMDMDDCIGLCEDHINQAIEMLNTKNKVLRK